MDIRGSLYWGVLTKARNKIKFQAKVGKNYITFTRRPMYVALFSTPLTRAHWDCLGSEAMHIITIHFTEEISEITKSAPKIHAFSYLSILL
jgi:hypothetical protein